jgi:hypothetical protein
VLMMQFLQVDAVFKLGFRVGVVKFGVFKSRCEGLDVVDFLVSILLLSKPPHHVKVKPPGEEGPQQR